MKAIIKIPNGWRRLRCNEIIKAGDYELWTGDMEWVRVPVENFTLQHKASTRGLIIRRIASKWAPNGYREVSQREWDKSMHLSYSSVWRYSDKSGKPLLTTEQWHALGELCPISKTRFFLRKGVAL